jgi:signal transduction histidine kinase
MAEDDKEQFISRVIHDLRNPLSSIKLAAYNIQRKAGGPLIDKHLETIDKKIEEINNILESLRR